MTEVDRKMTMLICRWQAKQYLCVELARLLETTKTDRDKIKAELKELETRKAGTNG